MLFTHPKKYLGCGTSRSSPDKRDSNAAWMTNSGDAQENGLARFRWFINCGSVHLQPACSSATVFDRIFCHQAYPKVST